MRALMFAVLFGCVGTLGIMAVTLAPRRGENVVVVFPPDTPMSSAFMAVRASGLTALDFPRSNLVLAASTPNQVHQTPRGAWLMIDAMGARGCSRKGQSMKDTRS